MSESDLEKLHATALSDEVPDICGYCSYAASTIETSSSELSRTNAFLRNINTSLSKHLRSLQRQHFGLNAADAASSLSPVPAGSFEPGSTDFEVQADDPASASLLSNLRAAQQQRFKSESLLHEGLSIDDDDSANGHACSPPSATAKNHREPCWPNDAHRSPKQQHQQQQQHEDDSARVHPADVDDEQSKAVIARELELDALNVELEFVRASVEEEKAELQRLQQRRRDEEEAVGAQPDSNEKYEAQDAAVQVEMAKVLPVDSQASSSSTTGSGRDEALGDIGSDEEVEQAKAEDVAEQDHYDNHRGQYAQQWKSLLTMQTSSMLQRHVDPDCEQMHAYRTSAAQTDTLLYHETLHAPAESLHMNAPAVDWYAEQHTSPPDEQHTSLDGVGVVSLNIIVQEPWASPLDVSPVDERVDYVDEDIQVEQVPYRCVDEATQTIVPSEDASGSQPLSSTDEMRAVEIEQRDMDRRDLKGSEAYEPTAVPRGSGENAVQVYGMDIDTPFDRSSVHSDTTSSSVHLQLNVCDAPVNLSIKLADMNEGHMHETAEAQLQTPDANEEILQFSRDSHNPLKTEKKAWDSSSYVFEQVARIEASASETKLHDTLYATRDEHTEGPRQSIPASAEQNIRATERDEAGVTTNIQHSKANAPCEANVATQLSGMLSESDLIENEVLVDLRPDVSDAITQMEEGSLIMEPVQLQLAVVDAQNVSTEEKSAQAYSVHDSVQEVAVQCRDGSSFTSQTEAAIQAGYCWGVGERVDAACDPVDPILLKDGSTGVGENDKARVSVMTQTETQAESHLDMDLRVREASIQTTGNELMVDEAVENPHACVLSRSVHVQAAVNMCEKNQQTEASVVATDANMQTDTQGSASGVNFPKASFLASGNSQRGLRKPASKSPGGAYAEHQKENDPEVIFHPYPASGALSAPQATMQQGTPSEQGESASPPSVHKLREASAGTSPSVMSVGFSPATVESDASHPKTDRSEIRSADGWHESDAGPILLAEKGSSSTHVQERNEQDDVHLPALEPSTSERHWESEPFAQEDTAEREISQTGVDVAGYGTTCMRRSSGPCDTTMSTLDGPQAETSNMSSEWLQSRTKPRSNVASRSRPFGRYFFASPPLIGDGGVSARHLAREASGDSHFVHESTSVPKMLSEAIAKQIRTEGESNTSYRN